MERDTYEAACRDYAFEILPEGAFEDYFADDMGVLDSCTLLSRRDKLRRNDPNKEMWFSPSTSFASTGRSIGTTATEDGSLIQSLFC